MKDESGHALAATYATARKEYRDAAEAAGVAYDRLEASPDTIEYMIDWNVARRREAAAAWRMRRAEEALRQAGAAFTRADSDP